jgi:hypothetical protein
MRALVRFAGLSTILAFGSCARQMSGAETVNGGNRSGAVDGGVPSKRHGLIVPSDPAVGISGPQSATGTESGRIDDSIGKGVGGGGSTP